MSNKWNVFTASMQQGSLRAGSLWADSLLKSWQNSHWAKRRKEGSGPEKEAAEISEEEGFSDSSAGEGAQEKEKEQQTGRNGSRLSPEAPAGETYGFSSGELQKAMAMSVILGPPVCRKRKRHEGYTGRR